MEIGLIKPGCLWKLVKRTTTTVVEGHPELTEEKVDVTQGIEIPVKRVEIFLSDAEMEALIIPRLRSESGSRVLLDQGFKLASIHRLELPEGTYKYSLNLASEITEDKTDG